MNRGVANLCQEKGVEQAEQSSPGVVYIIFRKYHRAQKLVKQVFAYFTKCASWQATRL